MLISLKTQVDRTAKAPIPACRARVGGLCRFRRPAERVPTRGLKTRRGVDQTDVVADVVGHVALGLDAHHAAGFGLHAGVDQLDELLGFTGTVGAHDQSNHMSDRKISGLTTAASLWCTACIGLAVGSGYILMAVAAGAIVLVILRLMQRIVHVNTLKRLEVQFIHRAQTLAFLNEYFMNLGVKVLDVDFHAESRPEGNLYTNLYTLSMPAKMSYVDVIGTLSEHPNIRTVRTRNL